MIRNILFVFLSIILLFSCSNEGVNIKGQIRGSNYDGETVYLYAIKSSDLINDPVFLAKTTVAQGDFKFEEIQNSEELAAEELPTIAFVTLFDMLAEDDSDDFSELPIATVVLEKGTVHLLFENESVSVSGTERNDKFNEIHKAITNLANLLGQKREYDELENVPVDNAGRDGIAQYQHLTQEFKNVTFDFAKENMTNNLGKFLFYSYAENMFTPAQLEILIELSDQTFKDRSDIKELTKILEQMHNAPMGLNGTPEVAE